MCQRTDQAVMNRDKRALFAKFQFVKLTPKLMSLVPAYDTSTPKTACLDPPKSHVVIVIVCWSCFSTSTFGAMRACFGRSGKPALLPG